VDIFRSHERREPTGAFNFESIIEHLYEAIHILEIVRTMDTSVYDSLKPRVFRIFRCGKKLAVVSQASEITNLRFNCSLSLADDGRDISFDHKIFYRVEFCAGPFLCTLESEKPDFASRNYAARIFPKYRRTSDVWNKLSVPDPPKPPHLENFAIIGV